ncbi:HECT-domain-containing protein [Hysterangium stoloniferum]|nr:HECT-domain-containing protein [Hysterangium stoloniferum]
MLPFESDSTSRRNINLGGASSQSSQAVLLDRARALRNARRDERNKEIAALKIRNWLSSQHGIQIVRAELRVQFDLGPQGHGHSIEDGQLDQTFLAWTRLLLLCGADEVRLYRWSAAMLDKGHDFVIGLLHGPQKDSWLFLMKRVSVSLLRKFAQDATSDQALLFLQFLEMIVSPASWTAAASRSVPVDITAYLLQNNLFLHVGSAFQQMPTTLKAATQHSVHLSRLIVSTFSHLSGSSTSYALAFLDFFVHILSVPLLPNRIPLKELPLLVSCIPWGDLPLFTSLPQTSSSTLNDLVLRIPRSLRPHVLANVLAFLSPRYIKLSSTALASYLELYADLLDSISPNQLETKPINQTNLATSSVTKPSVVHDESDSDEDDVMDIDVSPPNQSTSLPSMDSKASLDSRTISRLSNLTTAAHIISLLSATARHPDARPQLFRLILSLTVSVPSKKEQIWTTIGVSPGGGSGLIRECWRGYVRSSPLGKVQDDGATKVLMDPAHASAWPPLLLLVSLYSQTLLTMGDDEFFSLSSTSSITARNPLTVDDLIVFSRQLLNIAFPLYWFEDQAKVKESGPVGIRLTWEKVREIVSSCLKGIHARDSRRPFTPPEHWLLTSQLDLHSFVEAAVLEEQTLSNGDSEVTVISNSRHRRNGLSPRQIAHLSPRLGILNNIPFAIPFEVRVEIFRHFIRNDFVRTFRQRRSIEPINPALTFDTVIRPRRKRATVRRTSIAEDGFDQLSSLGSDLKGPVEIQFVDQFGQEEAGIDGGGVFKEFLTSLSREAFDTNRGLWLATQQQELYPNPHSYATEPHQLNWYRFIGRILGKALYEGILVDVAFAPFFLAKWLGKQSYLDDLASLDPELYNGLIFLKHFDKNFEDLSLNFTITAEDLGVSRTVNLIPHGDQVSVTKENRLQYIYLVSHYRLSRQIKRQSEAFFEGLSDIIDPKWLRMFNQQEVQILVGGVNAPIDLDDLRQNCNYGGLYDDDHETIVIFWKVINSFDHEQRRGLLRFVTSCGRPPLLGFKELYPKFSIRDSSSDEQRLPTSSTCVNLLKLPRYQSERVMRQKLIQAINSGAGFDLS